MKKCIVLEMENKTDFENAMNDYLSDGYKVEASSCNSKYYKNGYRIEVFLMPCIRKCLCRR